MSKVKRRLEIMHKKIEFILNICKKAGSISIALEDEQTTRVKTTIQTIFNEED